MLKSLTGLSSLLLLGGLFYEAHAFSLFGPFAIGDDGARWQVQRIGYPDPEGGGPMNAAAGEEYRWNTPFIVYAYDAAFIDFFGPRGVQEVEKAIKILNDLPPASQLNVDDYPMNTQRINFRAAALGLIDLKSDALALTLLEMGLVSPNRWVYCLRNRYQPGPDRFPVFFNVIRRNYETVPTTGGVVLAAETSYINGRLWTYFDIGDFDTPPESDVFNTTVDPLDFGRFDPVAASRDAFSGFSIGSYFSGLTRDDVMALKFIYQAGNWNYESLLPGSTNAGSSVVSGGTGSGPWTIPTTNVIVIPGGGGVGVGGLINPTVRFGVDKPTLLRGEYDSILGQLFTPVTVVFVETVVTNSVFVSQAVQRVITTPDILYDAADLQGPAEPGLIASFLDVLTVADGSWQNNNGLNGQAITKAGPGVIQPPVRIGFENVGFITLETATGFIGNAVQGVGGLPYFILGAFDGTTNEPVVFLRGGSISAAQLEQIQLGR
jgi:hypothetical protein